MKLWWLLASALICGCALGRPDHFYVLHSASGTLAPRNAFGAQVALHVTLPSLVDRSEMVLLDKGDVQILEHERWAAPLDDQFAAALGQDLEMRREDVILSSRRIAEPDIRTVGVNVEVVQLALSKYSGVRLEARWRIEDEKGGKIYQGRETFSAPADQTSFTGLTHALDVCIGLLADRLAAQLTT